MDMTISGHMLIGESERVEFWLENPIEGEWNGAHIDIPGSDDAAKSLVTIIFSYDKDNTIDFSEDAVWIDNLKFQTLAELEIEAQTLRELHDYFPLGDIFWTYSDSQGTLYT